MPLYEYECEACGKRFEVIQRFSDAPPDACTACGGGPVRRLLSSPAIQFKGTGWYITDYAQKGKSGAESTKDTDKKSDAAPAADSGTKSETPKADTAGSGAKSSTAKSSGSDS